MYAGKTTTQPKKITAPTKPATTTAISTICTKPVPSRKSTPASVDSTRKRSCDITSDDSAENTMVKKSRFGTLLKDLLQQASKMLLQAASKVEQFAPATVSSSEALKRIEPLEKQVKKHHQQTTTQLQEIREATSEIQQITPMLKLIAQKKALIDGKVQKMATTSNVREGNLAHGIRLDDIENEIKKLHEGIVLPDVQKLSFDINMMHGRFDTLERHLLLPPPTTAPLTERHAREDRYKDLTGVHDDRYDNVRRSRDHHHDDSRRGREVHPEDVMRGKDDRDLSRH
ncbi:hypothetical protein RB195_014093 [Necator americanus]|uniref:Uncharacterized protein n=1 Tax=Necator americanus TaxID=51031 RepID=A0ABR1DZ29_NECAM